MKDFQIMEMMSLIDDKYIEKEIPKMYRSDKKNNRIFNRSGARIAPRIIAIVIVIFISVSACFVIFNDNVRATITDAFTKWFDGYMEIDFSRPKPTPETTEEVTEAVTEAPKEVTEYTVGYIPDGFDLTEAIEDSEYRDYIYFAEDERAVLVQITTADNNAVFVDSDDVTYEHVLINGYKAVMIYCDEETTGTILIDCYPIEIMVMADLEREELIKIAENIK